MESPRESSGETREEPTPSRPAPTQQDVENARIRQEIAERMEAEYVECLRWALGAFGPGWLPSHRHFLVEKGEEERARRTGERAKAAATVYTVKSADSLARHFTVTEGGTVTECESYEAGFGPMLLEPHPTAGFEHKGVWCRVHRYSLCWAGYDLYHPQSVEQLAKLRQSRERKKEERADARWAEENPLLAWAGLRRDGVRPERD